MTTITLPINFGQTTARQKIRKPARLNVWSAFRVGMRLKTNAANSRRAIVKNLVKVCHKPKLLSRALTPIDYVRIREFDFALRAIADHNPRPQRLLDISSPKLLPLTIAAAVPECRVTITDILQKEVNWAGNAASRLNLNNVRAKSEDARCLTFPDDCFDLITSISVFEHIAPEDGGEIPAVREMARVLAPRGIAIITVPFSRRYFADYRAGDVYERESAGNKPIFFQRFYDYELLQRNIIRASGLELMELNFIEERNFLADHRRRMSQFINSTATQLSMFGPMYPLLSHLFLSQPKPLQACQKPYLACLVLRKFG